MDRNIFTWNKVRVGAQKFVKVVLIVPWIQLKTWKMFAQLSQDTDLRMDVQIIIWMALRMPMMIVVWILEMRECMVVEQFNYLHVK
mgnify:CR=1 FL=1